MKTLDILNKLVWTALVLMFIWKDITWKNILICAGLILVFSMVTIGLARLLKKNETHPGEETSSDIDGQAATRKTDSPDGKYVKVSEGEGQSPSHRTFRYLLAVLFVGAVIAAFLNSRTFDAIRQRRAMSFTYVAEGDFHAPGRYVIGGVVQPGETGHEKGMILVNVIVDRLGNVVDARVNGASSITDSLVLESACEAAMMTRFTEGGSIPERQEALITYRYTRER